jgi:hypothetical protein
MAPKRWTNAEQLAFLESQIQPFLAAQEKKQTSAFLNDLEREYLAKFSEKALLFPLEHELSADDNERLGKAVEKRKMVRYEELLQKIAN